MSKNVKQLLPKGSKEIIKRALESYQYTIGIILDKQDNDKNNNVIDNSCNLRDENFDCYSLIGMMNYDVEVTLSKQDVEDFGQHNVDFPVFGEVKRMYPVKKEFNIYTIKKSVFLNWYFVDKTDYENLGKQVVKKLVNEEGKYDIEFSVLEVFDSCNHNIIPFNLTQEYESFVLNIGNVNVDIDFGICELGDLKSNWKLKLTD